MKTRGKTFDTIAALLFALFLGLGVWAVQTARWEARHWDNLTMNEVVNQLATPVEGTGSAIIGEFVMSCVVPGCAAALLAGLALFLLRKRAWFGRLAHGGVLLGAAFFLGMLAYGYELLGVGEYLRDSSTESNYIEDNYVDPRSVRLTFPEKKRNLIFIWLESMESTFSDTEHGGAFPMNTIPELTAIAEENVSFTGGRGGVNGAYSVAGTTWTMGALFAQTGGLPLKIPVTDSGMDTQSTFFPGMTNLGDILAENGYRQGFLIGSKGNFAGRRLYFEQHGDYSVWDYNYSVERGDIPEDYYVWWGYEDEKLFEYARRHLTELAASDEPFNLSLLTVDTHFPDGWVCELCGDEFGDDRYSNVMACSSRQVAAFLDWIKEQPFYENTTVVLSGDHITMNVGYCDGIDPAYRRHVYTTIVNPAAEEADASRFREYASMDVFPTTLAALGVEIEGDRLGLGVNLFSGRETLVERDGFEEVDRQMKRRSAFVDSLSGFTDEVFALSDALHTLDTMLEADFREDGIYVSVHNFAPYMDDIEKLGVFPEIIEGNTRTTLSMQTAEPYGEGSWFARIPYEAVEDYDTFLINLYATTTGGRIKVDAGYTCDKRAQTVTRLPLPAEGGE